MIDLHSLTRYRVAQHWRFHSDTPEARDTLTILAVENHPTQGIICNVNVQFNPAFPLIETTEIDGGEYWVTQAALDRSVIKLVKKKGRLPEGLGSTGEFVFGADGWGEKSQPFAAERTVGELLREETEQLKKQRDEMARTPKAQTPPVEALGLWSLIVNDEAIRLEQLLHQHPSIANDPRPRDPSDDYCYTGDEYEECYPLMLAAEMGAVEVSRTLLKFNARPGRQNARGDSALHFAARCSNRGDGAAKVAKLLCDRGADPEARNAEGNTPLSCSCCPTDVAKVLVEAGANPTLNYAIRLRMIDKARQDLRNNPNAIRDASSSGDVLVEIGALISDLARIRHGREVRLRKGEIPAENEDGWPDRMAHSSVMSYTLDDRGAPIDDGKLAFWRRHAEIEKTVFDEHLDILELAVARGADPNAGSALFHAVQMLDTSWAEWLLANGADPNRDVKSGTANYMPDLAQTHRMLNLLERFDAKKNPYRKSIARSDKKMQTLLDRLRDQFD